MQSAGRPRTAARAKMATLAATNRLRGPQPNCWARLTLVLVALLLLLGQLQAKTHHSKRQAGANNSPGQPAPATTGRENTNWWNLWWQQYIDEAVQPTVRPIVGVSFAGKTISLPADNRELSPEAGNSRDQRDVESNFVLGGGENAAPSQQQQLELGRNGMRLREPNLPNNMHPSLAHKQALLVQRKSVERQANWQMVRPTIIQMRDSRTNRQAGPALQANELDVGIQMRASMGRQQQQQQVVDLNQMPMEFEQQQNQMVDYAEEGEPDLDNSIGGPGGQQQQAGDSSSSSMMMSPPAPRRPTSGGEMRATNQPEMATRRPLSGGFQPDEERGGGMMEQQQQQQQGGFRQEPGQLPAGGATGRQPSGGSSTQLGGRTEQAPENNRQTVATSTLAPTTTTTKSAPQTGEVDVNETPISMGQNERQPATMPATMQSFTGSGPRAGSMGSASGSAAGRVELQNGRPASGMGQQRQQQQATTTSARLPTLPGQTRAMMTSTSAGASKTTPGMSAGSGEFASSTTSESSVGSSTEAAEQFTTTTMASVGGGSSVEPAAMGADRQTTPAVKMTSPSSLGATNDDRASQTTTPASNRTEANKAETDDDGEEETDGNLLKTGPNVEGGDESDDNASDNEDADEEDQPEAMSTLMPGSGDLQKTTTSSPAEAASKTTQQPASMTTIELERLTPGEGPSTTSRATTNKPETTQFVMMTLKPADREGAIALPMDTLMKMMMNQVALENENERLQTTTTTTGRPTVGQSSAGGVSQTSGDGSKQRLMMMRPIIGETKMMTTVSERLTEEQQAGTSQTRGKGAKLQPPPTTKMPSASTSGGALKPTTSGGEQSSSSVGQSQGEPSTSTTPRTMTISVGGGRQAVQAGDEEPKIELLNLDLVPIRKMMGSQQQQQQQQQDRDESGGKKMVLMMQSPVRMGSQEPLGTSGGASESADQRRQKMMEQLMGANAVEPGMRLRPPAMGSAPEQPEGGRAANQPNTVYMIMMNNGRQQPVIVTSTSANATAHSKKPAQMSSSATLAPQTNRPLPPATETRATTKQSPVSTTSQTARITSPQATSSAPMRSGARTTTPAQATTTTTSQQQQSAVSVSQPAASSTKTTLGRTTEPAQAGGSSLMTPQPTTSRPEQQDSVRTMGSSLMRSAGERTTKEEPTQTSSPMGEGAGSSTPRTSPDASSSSSPQSPSAATMPTTTAPASSTSAGPRRDQEEEAGTTPATSTTTGNNKQRQQQPGGGDQSARLQEQQQQQQSSSSAAPPAGRDSAKRPQTKTKTAGKPSNATSSFIPSKLRMDFSSKTSRLQQQQANATNSEPAGELPAKSLAGGFAQNMAIRQFGGANRMSALANQPVPFGRPAAMTMQGQQQAQGAPIDNRVPRVEVPSFEYGPSIAVRRPDEPLANGQMPNCTLAGKNFCVLTKDYPMNEVRQAVERSFRSVRIMYEELQTVSDQELHKDDFNATNNQAASGKFACQTQVEMMRPGWAKDEITKEWMLVVNTDVFPQRVRTESCAQPNTPCEFIAPFYDSTCQQRYSLHRMIAIDPHDPSRSPQVAVFKFPAGCVCRVHPIKKSIPTTSTTSPL